VVADGGGEVVTLPRRDADGRLVRPPRQAAPAADRTSVAGLVRNGLFFTGEAANLAGFCMSDHLGDDHVIRDMHNIIGALSSVQSLFQLIEYRTVTRDEAIAAGAVACTATYLRHPNLVCRRACVGDRRHTCHRLVHDGRHRCLCDEEWDG
jgi:hypothetical protein